MKHQITNADLINKVGDCSVCGPGVELLVSSKPYSGRKALQRYCAQGKRDAKNKSRRHLSRLYGITPEQFNEMLVAQGGLCKICNTAPATHVDHCHATLEVRGLLCNNCNAGLGMFGDDQDRLKSAVAYLTASQDVP